MAFVPQRGAATAVLQAHVVVGVATEACLVLHSLVPHADAAGGASTDSFPIHATRPGPHANTIAPLASQRGTPHRQARVLGRGKKGGDLRDVCVCVGVVADVVEGGNSRAPAAAGLSAAAAASGVFRLPAAFPAEPVPAAFPFW